MKDSRKAVFLDIDGTLLSHNQGPFDEDVAALMEARQQGYLVFLSTGRALGNIPPVLRDAPWIDGIVAGAGAHILFQGKAIYSRRVPPSLLAALSAYYLADEKYCIFEGEAALYGINARKAPLVSGEALEIRRADDFSRLYGDPPVTKLTIEGTASAQERLLMEEFLDICHFSDYFEGIIRGENKALGMERLLEAAGMGRENAIAIGDSLNDLEMIRYAALGIAMGNACGELKEAAGAITADCGQGGVGLAVRKWVLS